MDLIPVACNHCGASLQIPESARFVTCRYCNTQLEIKRTDSTITTEVLQRIDQTTTAMAQDLQAIRRESEIERLDREWDITRQSLLIRDKRGNTSVPTAAMGIGGAVVMGVFGVFWTIMAIVITSADSGPSMSGFSNPGFPGAGFPHAPGFLPIVQIIFPLFGVVFILAAIFLGIKTTYAARQYAQEEQRYRTRRQDLLNRSQPTASTPGAPNPQ